MMLALEAYPKEENSGSFVSDRPAQKKQILNAFWSEPATSHQELRKIIRY